MRRELTDTWLRGVKPPASGRLEIWDTRVAGLVLRITFGGTATWSVRARTADGKRTRPKLGTWPAVGISEARKRALGAVAEIQDGGDPVATKRALQAARKARAGLPTVSERLAEWQATKADKWSDRYQGELLRLCTKEIEPKLGKRPLVETTREDWTKLIAAKHRNAPGIGSMLYRTAAAFLNHAEAHGWIPLPLLPRKGLALIAPPVGARKRTLTDEELKAVWTAADRLNRAKSRVFVHLLAMTATRQMEVADVSIGEIDLEAGKWAIPGSRTKNGCGIVVPLHPLLLDDLRAIWPEHAAGPSWKLLGEIAGSGFRGFSKLKARLDKAAGVTGWRWHDLRRTARTGMTQLGISRDHAEAALNHISGRSALERTYDRHNYGPEVLVALKRWQLNVAALVTGAKPAEVVPLRRQA